MNEDTPAITLQPHQQRVVDEKVELDERMRKLDAFMGTPTYFALHLDERMRLGRQMRLMNSLSLVLGDRIAAFRS